MFYKFKSVVICLKICINLFQCVTITSLVRYANNRLVYFFRLEKWESTVN